MEGGKNFLVLCSGCQRARDQNDNWVKVNRQIIDHADVLIRHALCQECEGTIHPQPGKESRKPDSPTWEYET